MAAALNAMTLQLKSQIETITADRNVTLAILASMVEGVVAVDREDYVVHVNSAAEVILGIDAKNAKGRRIWEVTRVVEVGEALNDAMRKTAPSDAHSQTHKDK
jgi:two-component system phosphate regulon sensor histidine kinase PhoR